MATVAHRGSHDKISACDWLDTLHRGSKWQEVTIFSNIRTADRGSKSQSHFTNILRTKNDQLRAKNDQLLFRDFFENQITVRC